MVFLITFVAAVAVTAEPATPRIVSQFVPENPTRMHVVGIATDGLSPEFLIDTTPPPLPHELLVLVYASTAPPTPVPEPVPYVEATPATMREQEAPPRRVQETPVRAAAVAPVVDDIKGLICSYDWDCTTALRVAKCESTYIPTAENGRFKGIFQLDSLPNGGHFATYGYDVNAWADPYVNVAVAYQLYLSRGWQPWSCK